MITVDNNSSSSRYGYVYIVGRSNPPDNYLRFHIWNGSTLSVYTGDTSLGQDIPEKPFVFDNEKVYVPLNGAFTSGGSNCGSFFCQLANHKYFIIDPSGSVSGYNSSPTTSFSQTYIYYNLDSVGVPLAPFQMQVKHGHDTNGTIESACASKPEAPSQT